MVEVDFEEVGRIKEAEAGLREEILRQKSELQSKREHLAKLQESEELLLGLRLTAPLRRVRSAFRRRDGRG